MLSEEVHQIEMEKSLAKQGRHRWLPYLTLVLLAETCLTVHFLRYDPDSVNWLADWQARFASARRAEQLQTLMGNDPQAGQRIQQNSAMRLPDMDEKELMLTVFIGACSSCMAKILSQWENVKTESQRFKPVLVVRDSPQRIKAFWKEHRLTLPFVADPKGDLHKAYNVIYVPRAYAINAQGQLVWIQKNDYLSPGEITRLAEASVGGKSL
jgi:peroxiredoxin